MSNASSWLKEAVLNHFFRATPQTSPTGVYLALYKDDPTEADVGTEITGGGYVRQLIQFGVPAQVSGAGTITNTNDIAFPEATADWTGTGETVSYWGIRTALTGGTLLAFGEFTDASKPNNGKYAVTKHDQFNVGAGRVTIQFNLKASTWLQNAVLNHFFRGTSTPGPASVFLALYTTNPTADDTGLEISYSAYARQQITFEAPALQATGESLIKNDGTIDFPIPDADLGNVGFFGVRSAATAGNLLAFSPWSAEKTILAGMMFSVNMGNLEISMS
jgi:hypothetical protein